LCRYGVVRWREKMERAVGALEGRMREMKDASRAPVAMA
jgi:hypothetical protein